MLGWGGYPAVIAGLLAVMLLTGAISLAGRDEDERTNRVLMMLSAGGLAAAALFGGLLVLQLLFELVKAVGTFSLA